MNEKFLTYRGDVTAVDTVGTSIVFTTKRPEGDESTVGTVDAEKLELAETPLPCSGRDLLVDGETIWVAGGDGHVYELSPKRKTPKASKAVFDPPPTGLALLDGNRLGVLTGETLAILDRKSTEIVQSLELPAEGTAIASDPTGQWLVAGTNKGHVAVFDCEEKDEFLANESEKLHDGSVTTLLFEPEELRFLSAGADGKLLVTHARGTLEPEDRGRGGMHDDVVTGIVHVPGDRFVTGSRDGSCKSWARGDRTRPSTQSDDLVAVVGLTVVEIHGRPHLVAACHDRTLRLFLLDAGGKIAQPTHRIRGALDHAHNELKRPEPKRREAALRLLAEWGDGDAIDLLASTVDAEEDAGLRRLAAKLIVDSGHPRAVKHLESLLEHADDAVRLAAFEGLRAIEGPTDFRPLDLALATNHENVAIAAAEAFAELAANDDRAHARLVDVALEHREREVAVRSLLALERVHGDDPEGDLLGLTSRRHPWVRRLSLIRVLQREFLDRPRVVSAVRRELEESDADVRHTAFHVLVLSRPDLAKALRGRDASLHRQLFELESFELEKESKTRKPPKVRASKFDLDPADLAPLLWAASSRALDSSLAGARGLATLGDGRALGILLQLSREDEVTARVDVCRGLADLADERATRRLLTLLDDEASDVRDAAFSALTKVYDDEPTVAAAAGLAAGEVDVRRRALDLLVRTIRKKPPKKAGQPGWDELLRALDDHSSDVRTEAFKACLNAGVAGGDADTLRFVRRSVHEDVRREVLTETVARIREPWAWDLLLEFVDDPAADLRTEALELALKQTKRRDLRPLEAGLRSKYPDVRRVAIEELEKQRKAEARDLLATALDDDDLPTRQRALRAVVDVRAGDVLRQALENRHIDIRLEAGCTLAKLGDPACYEPLLELVRQERPDEDDPRFEAWERVVATALDGLSDLGDPRIIEHLGPYLADDSAEVRKQVAVALTWSARPEHVDQLLALLPHEDRAVRHQAALGLAVQGREEAAPIVLGSEFLTEEGIGVRFLAVFSLGLVGESELLRTLDGDSAQMRRIVYLVLLLREWRSHDGTPRRLLACLSSAEPRIRLRATEGLRCFANPDEFAEFVRAELNDRGDAEPWEISAETIATVAELVVHAEPWIRPRVVTILMKLFDDEQKHFDEKWESYESRFADEIARLEASAADRTPPDPVPSREELDGLAFGTFVALVREQHGGQNVAAADVRRTAIARVGGMAGEDDSWRAAAQPVLVQALGDPVRDVRNDAFETLLVLGMETSELATEAIETGHVDLGVRALDELTSSASKAEGRRVLEEVMLTRPDELSRRAAQLARESGNPLKVATAALDARYEPMRRTAVHWLEEAYDEEPKAGDALRKALESRFPEVREEAAGALARKRDTAAFEALAAMLVEATDAGPQCKLIEAIVELGDPRGPGVLLDRLEDDPTGTARHKELIQGAGRFRRPEDADRLLGLMDHEKWRSVAYYSLRRLAGFDQPIEDPEDERPDKTWEQRQFPRHDGVLARTMERLVEFGEIGLLKDALDGARWARSNAVDDVLGTITTIPDDDLRNRAVQTLGWRVRKRDASADGLVKSLEQNDPTTRFLAAESLALAGRDDGLNVLLAAVELLDDLALRRRAVTALGELADERALDLLLRFAAEDAHALQPVAAEAIGHLGRSEKRKEILELLTRFAKSENQPDLAARAVRGLRWFDSPDGWQLVRDRARLGDDRVQWTAIEVLRHNDDPATRDLLLAAIAREGDFEHYWEYEGQAVESARVLFGEDSLEPDYAVLRSDAFDEYSARAQFDRVTERGDADRILEICRTCDRYTFNALVAALVVRDPLPLDAALAALESVHAAEVQAAATLAGYAEKVSAAGKKSLEAALETWLGKWREYRATLTDDELDYDSRFEELSAVVPRLAWAAGRHGCGEKVFVDVLSAPDDDSAFRPIRHAALAALGRIGPAKKSIKVVESLLLDTDAEVRRTAAAILATHAPAEAEPRAGELLADRVTFGRFVANPAVNTSTVASGAVSQPHYQGVVLPVVVNAGDEKSLAATAGDDSLPESTRLGAIEGLAAVASTKAEKQLEKIGKSDSFDEELRKAAWRGLRRSKRQREATGA